VNTEQEIVGDIANDLRWP